MMSLLTVLLRVDSARCTAAALKICHTCLAMRRGRMKTRKADDDLRRYCHTQEGIGHALQA
jgi:hypothetical protein